MNLIKPKPLKKGDTIGFLSAAGCVEDVGALEKAKSYFESCGFNVVISQNSYIPQNYLASNDQDRISALESFFTDDSIDAIVCVRGGYGSLRIIEKINYNLIRSNPKIFVGSSDITALLLSIYKKTGLITFHGPMICSDFAQDINEFTAVNFFGSLEKNIKKVQISDYKVYHPGKAKGRLFGGNLSTLASLCGLDFVPEEDIILFLEDINEPVYKIDKMFTQLFNIKSLKSRVKALILGGFAGADNVFWLEDFFGKLSLELDIPVVSTLKIGHNEEKFTLPVGVKAEFDSSFAQINLTEGYLAIIK